MQHYQIICSTCQARVLEEPAYKCPVCGGILEIRYPPREEEFIQEKLPGVFRFARYLPVDARFAVSLGEGGTPLVPLERLAFSFGVAELYAKLEGQNPTASFKDRGIAVTAAKARELSKKAVIIASSGNASASAAAYAARCGLQLVAVVPEGTPRGKVLQVSLHGACVVKVAGGYSYSYRMCRRIAETYNMFDMTTTFLNPYAREGYKTIGYELYEALKEPPDWVVIPVGAGPILAAVKQSFDELLAMQLIERVPRLACVQAAGCGPIASAFLTSSNTVSACLDAKPTIASGINDPLDGYTEDGDYTLACIRQTSGGAVLLSEKEIVAATRLLAGEGIFAEPAGAVGIVAVQKLRFSGAIRPTDRVVIIVTGHGLKNPLAEDFAEPPTIREPEDLVAYLYG